MATQHVKTPVHDGAAEAALLVCPHCGAGLDEKTVRQGAGSCRRCGTPFKLHIFPAMLQEGRSGHEAADRQADEAACFHHPAKQARHICEGCGRFLCDLCVLPYRKASWCTACLERRQRQGDVDLTCRFTRYDRISYLLGILPVSGCFFSVLLMFVFDDVHFWIGAATVFVITSFFLAPLALYVLICHWRTPLSLLPVSRLAMLSIALLALVETALAWIVVILMFVVLVLSL